MKKRSLVFVGLLTLLAMLFVACNSPLDDGYNRATNAAAKPYQTNFTPAAIAFPLKADRAKVEEYAIPLFTAQDLHAGGSLTYLWAGGSIELANTTKDKYYFGLDEGSKEIVSDTYTLTVTNKNHNTTAGTKTAESDEFEIVIIGVDTDTFTEAYTYTTKPTVSGVGSKTKITFELNKDNYGSNDDDGPQLDEESFAVIPMDGANFYKGFGSFGKDDDGDDIMIIVKTLDPGGESGDDDYHLKYEISLNVIRSGKFLFQIAAGGFNPTFYELEFKQQ